jgi:hypothetical protein
VERAEDTFETGGGGGFDGGSAGLGEKSTGGSSYLSPSAVQTKFTPAMRTTPRIGRNQLLVKRI